DGADRDVGALQLGELLGKPPGQRVAGGDHADHDQPPGPVVALDDLVGDAGERAAHGVRVHDVRLDSPARRLAASRQVHESSMSSSAIRIWTPLRAWRK